MYAPVVYYGDHTKSAHAVDNGWDYDAEEVGSEVYYPFDFRKLGIYSASISNYYKFTIGEFSNSFYEGNDINYYLGNTQYLSSYPSVDIANYNDENQLYGVTYPIDDDGDSATSPLEMLEPIGVEDTPYMSACMIEVEKSEIYCSAYEYNDLLFLQYMFYYSYDPKVNNGTMSEQFSRHCSDRERVILILDKDGNDFTDISKFKPKGVLFFHHLPDQGFSYFGDNNVKNFADIGIDDLVKFSWNYGNDENQTEPGADNFDGAFVSWDKVIQTGNHPHVYIAQGSHGCYFREGTYSADLVIKGIDLFNHDLFEYAGGEAEKLYSISSGNMIYLPRLSTIDTESENTDFSFILFSGCAAQTEGVIEKKVTLFPFLKDWYAAHDYYNNGNPVNDVSYYLQESTNTTIPSVRLPDTGQIQTYANKDIVSTESVIYSGQDGHYSRARSYFKLNYRDEVLTSNATVWHQVRDNVTGLVWEVKHDNDGSEDYETPNDADNKYTWFDPGAGNGGDNVGTDGEGTDTDDFISAMNAGSGYCGHTDWRLPTVAELSRLTNLGMYKSTFNGDYFPDRTEPQYWTSTTCADNTENAWVVYLNSGTIPTLPKSSRFYVRAVRSSGLLRSLPLRIENEDKTVVDPNLGLMWQRYEGEATSWGEALKYCETLKLAGYDDWRLPDRYELQSLVDYNHSQPSISDYNFFPNISTSYYWSSTTNANLTGFAWLVGFSTGGLSNKDKSSNHCVRAVRSIYTIDEVQPDIEVNQQALDFGEIAIGESSQRELIISNNGSAALQINDISIDGSDDFSFTGNCNAETLVPGSGCAIMATFAPSLSGSKVATLSIKSNDSDESDVHVPLTGVGAGSGGDGTKMETAFNLGAFNVATNHDYSGEDEWYQFNLQAGEGITVALTGHLNSGNLHIYLYDSSGSSIDSATNIYDGEIGQFDKKVGSSGTYYLRVTGSAIGNYDLAVYKAWYNAGVVDSDRSFYHSVGTSRQLENGSYTIEHMPNGTGLADWYRFSAQAGETFSATLTAHLNSGNLHIYLYDSSGSSSIASSQYIYDGQSKELSKVINKTGLYYLKVVAGSAEGSYSLSISGYDSDTDADKDGLSDVAEYYHGTDPEKFDSDGDEKDDYQELSHGGKPLAARAYRDNEIGLSLGQATEIPYFNKIFNGEKNEKGSEQWYQFNLQAGEGITVALTGHLNSGNLHIYLYDSSGSSSIASSQYIYDGQSKELSKVINKTGLYYLKVVAGSAEGSYSLMNSGYYESLILQVSPSVQEVSAASVAATFAVSKSGAGTINWMAVTDDSWLTLSDESLSGRDDGTITVNFTANESSSERTGSITVTAPEAENKSTVVDIIQHGAVPVEKPDLTTSASISSSSYIAGSLVSVPVTVNRYGGLLSAGTYVNARIYWSQTSNWRPSLDDLGNDKLLWEALAASGHPLFQRDTLNSSSSITKTVQIRLPESTGTGYLILYVDPPFSEGTNVRSDGYHDESNESNNGWNSSSIELLLEQNINISRSSINFGNVVVGSASGVETVVISNQGDANLTLGTLSLTGTGANDFSLVSNSCSASVLASGESCTVSITCTPSVVGSRNAVLQIPSNDPDTSIAEVQLAGVGVSACTEINYYRDSDSDGYGDPNYVIQSCTKPTGYVADGSDCNDNDANEHPGQTWYRDIDGDHYSDGTINTNSCARPVGYFVANELTAISGDHDDNDGTIYPEAPELCDGKDNDQDGEIDEECGLLSLNEVLDNDLLTFTTGGDALWYGQDLVFEHGGSAAQSGKIEHDQVSWIETTVTGPVELSFYWKVSSEKDYDLLGLYVDGELQSSISGEVDWQSESITISAGSHTVKWAYEKDVSDNSGEDAGWLDWVTLAGVGDPANIQISRSSINFGNVVVGSASGVETVEISNQGDANLTLGTLSLTGTGANDFSLVSNSCSASVLASGESCTVSIACTPSVVGSRNAVLQIPSNDPDTSIVEVQLAGVGVSACIEINYYRDSDSDGYGDPNHVIQSCTKPTGYVADGSDCNDNDANEHPGQTWYRDFDGDHHSDGTINTNSCARPAGYFVANELTAISGDHDDNDSTIYPGAPELCDGKDNDQDGKTDEGVGSFYYFDGDKDGYGDSTKSLQSCTKPAAYVDNDLDDDDSDNTIYPGAPELCDGKDNNQNGETDEGCSSISLNTALDNETLIFQTAGDALWSGQNVQSEIGDSSALSGEIEHNQTSWIKTTVVGPAQLSFFWKVSSEESGDYLKFCIADELQYSISGEVDWVAKSVAIPAGSYEVKWAYEKNSSLSRGEDCGWLDSVRLEYVSLPASIQISRSTIDFGSITVGSASVAESLVISNQGDADLTIGNLSFVGTGANDFSFFENPCSLSTLDPGENCRVSIVCTPAVVGSRNAVLRISSSDQDTPIVEVPLLGTGVSLCTEINYYRDRDGDGYGDPGDSVLSCTKPTGYVINASDLDDSDSTIYPGAPELCDGKDNNQDGETDEGCSVISLNEALDNNTLIFTTAGDALWSGQDVVFDSGGSAAQSGEIDDYQSSWIETTVVGPKNLFFSWKVSSEEGYDHLDLLVDGVLRDSISGDIDWTLKSIFIPAGTHVVKWLYEKDQSVSYGEDAGWIDFVSLASLPNLIIAPANHSQNVGFAEGTTTFLVSSSGMNPVSWVASESCAWLTITDGLSGASDGMIVVSYTENTGLLSRVGTITITSPNAENSPLTVTVVQAPTAADILLATVLDNDSLVFTSAGDASWSGQGLVSEVGGSAAQSGDIEDDQVSWIETTVTGPSELSFSWKVSSEAGYDFLKFSVGGELWYSISGEVDWVSKRIIIPAGSHVVKWAYEKDSSVSDGYDTGWLDSVSLTTTSNPFIDISYVSSRVNSSGKTPLYDSIQAAINDAFQATEIKITQGTYQEEVDVGVPLRLKLSGGFGEDFSQQGTGLTEVKGCLTISAGILEVDNLVISGTNQAIVEEPCTVCNYWSYGLSLVRDDCGIWEQENIFDYELGSNWGGYNSGQDVGGVLMLLQHCDNAYQLDVSDDYAIEVAIVEPASGVYFMDDNISNNQALYAGVDCGTNHSRNGGVVVESFADSSQYGEPYCAEFTAAAKSFSYCPVDPEKSLLTPSQGVTNFCFETVAENNRVKVIRTGFSSFLENLKPMLMVDLPTFFYEPYLVSSGTAVKVKVSLVRKTIIINELCSCIVTVGVFE